MENSHGHAELLPRLIGQGAAPEPAPAPMGVTVLFRSAGAAGYGRHAAPPSAYGPSDLHRLLPEPPTVCPATEETDFEKPPVEAIDDAVEAELVAAGGVDSGDRSADEVSTKTTGFWARLRLSPKAA
ncbi:hypothetical protein ABC795_01215 [Blastococcus sp. HT6-30]|uniref:hypothetical protein n=1 Tax=Blastococcus sp. HT6-30 TaxID=3144843 RepID=UPI00321B9C98